MTARVTFFPIGNADCCRIDLVGGRKVLIDFADKRDPKDPYDKRIDLAAEVRRDLDDAARVIRQEARHRLKQGKGIKVFSRPERLHDLLESWGLTVADRASCIVD